MSDVKAGQVVPIIIALLSLVVSIVAIIFTSAQFSYQRAHDRLLAKPEMYMSKYYNEQSGGINIYNRGLGSAKIYGLHIIIDGQPVRDRHMLVSGLGLTENMMPNSYEFSVPTGTVIYSQGSRVLLKVTDLSAIAKLREKDSLRFTMCFCSIYEECWAGIGRKAEPIANCDEYEELNYGH